MKRLTTEEIEAIRKRASLATEGPWCIEKSGCVCNAGYWTEDTLIMPDISSNVYGKNDAEFIANARKDIPKLLAEIGDLREENEILREDFGKCERQLEGMLEQSERNYDKYRNEKRAKARSESKLKAEIARLKAQLGGGADE